MMTNYNKNYDRGAIWKTRTLLTGYIDFDLQRKIPIPRGELVMLLYYSMNLNYEEEVVVLWDKKIVYLKNVDTGASFFLDIADKFT